MKKILLLLAICLIGVTHEVTSMVALAGCSTGYACLLKDVKQQGSVIQTMQQEIINNYYKPKMLEPQLKEYQIQMPSYRDLFPFLSKYY